MEFLNKAEDLKELNDHLGSRSFIGGDIASSADDIIFGQVAKIQHSLVLEYPHVVRWYSRILNFRGATSGQAPEINNNHSIGVICLMLIGSHISTSKRLQYMQECLASNENFPYVYVSISGSPEAISSLQIQFPNVNFIISNERKSQFQHYYILHQYILNLGFDLINTYLCFCDDDDLSHPKRYKIVQNELNEDEFDDRYNPAYYFGKILHSTNRINLPYDLIDTDNENGWMIDTERREYFTFVCPLRRFNLFISLMHPDILEDPLCDLFFAFFLNKYCVQAWNHEKMDTMPWLYFYFNNVDGARRGNANNPRVTLIKRLLVQHMLHTADFGLGHWSLNMMWDDLTRNMMDFSENDISIVLSWYKKRLSPLIYNPPDGWDELRMDIIHWLNTYRNYQNEHN